MSSAARGYAGWRTYKLSDWLERPHRTEVMMDTLAWDEHLQFGQQRPVEHDRVEKLMLELALSPLQQPLEPLLWRRGGMP